MSEVIIGTSGYFFRDWVGNFYPRGLPQNKWLSYYTQYFDGLELNSTFYRIPQINTAKSLASKLGGGFHLIVKVPQSITHKFDIKKTFEDIENLLSFCEPLEKKGILEGFLAQFPGSFRQTKENEEILEKILIGVPKPLFVEFRHISWLTDKTRKTLEKHNVGWVIPDVPNIEGLMPNTPIVTAESAYIRLHGRNKEGWYSGGQRYNYLYSQEEISWLFNIVKDLLSEVSKVYVFFNNCHSGKAVANAIHLARLFGKVSEEPSLF